MERQHCLIGLRICESDYHGFEELLKNTEKDDFFFVVVSPDEYLYQDRFIAIHHVIGYENAFIPLNFSIMSELEVKKHKLKDYLSKIVLWKGEKFDKHFGIYTFTDVRTFTEHI